MSETLRDLVVSLSLQTDNFTRNIKSVNKQIQEAESKFRLAAAGIEGFEKTAQGLTAQLSTLERRLVLQKDAVTQYERALAAANSKLQECFTKQNDYARRLADAKTAQQALKEQVALAAQQYRTFASALGETDSATIASKANLDLLKVEYRAQCAEVRKLSGQNIALKKTTQNAADAVSKANTDLNGARAAVKTTEAEIVKCNRSLALARTSWDSAGMAIENSKTAITTFGKQIALAENRFKLAAVGIKDIDTSADGLSAKLTMLSEKMALQEKTVSEYENALAAAKMQLQAAQDANDPDKVQEATDAVIDAESALVRAKTVLAETKREISLTNEALITAQSAWTQAGKSLESFSKNCDHVSRTTGTVGRTLSTALTTPLLALGASAIKASVSYESAFTSVRKTVDATEGEFASLSDEIKGMSTEIATSADDIAEVVAIAGQLGIGTDHLTEFARTMIDLGNSTDIVASEAASTLAKFANITGMDQRLFGNLGSSLVALGNNFATTESSIMTMAMRLAAAGHQVGLSEAQILGFATALSSVGIEAEMGGSAFSKALIKMEVASATGGQALEDFARISGMTAEQFKLLWDSDPASAFQAFIVGLSQMDEAGMSAIATLDEIGIGEIRLRDTLLRATNATGLFSEAQIMANYAWEDNTALTEEAGKRYQTTASRLTNLKNKALLFGQQIGDDMNPMIQEMISGTDDLLDRFMAMDEAQRMQLLQWAALASTAGPALLGFSKVTKGISVLAGSIGKFSIAVGKAGGGFSGFLSVLGKSPSFWFAAAAATLVGTAALADYVSGAKQAREALEGMAEVARDWKTTAADTFYSTGAGLSFFDMSASDFTRESASPTEWLDGVIAEWTDGQRETDEIVSHWIDSFQRVTDVTRQELQKLKEDAESTGFTAMSDQIGADIGTLDQIDAEIERLLRRRKGGVLGEKDRIRLEELIDTREAIVIKYSLSPADTDGFDTIRKKVEAEKARAHARGEEDAPLIVYENAAVGAAQGMAAMNKQIDEQYDKEYAIIQMMEDESERKAALEALDARYLEQRRSAALAYAETLSSVVMPVWNSADIQKAGSDIELLTLKLREYTTASEDEKPGILADLESMAASMDEGGLTEYIALLMQIQSLLDSGMTESEVQALFPEIDFSEALEQLAAIQLFLNGREGQLPGLHAMFGEALPDEVLTIATDLDMTGAQTRWAEFAANPGAITTDAVIQSFVISEAALAQQPQVDAFIAKYTEIPEGASTVSLTPEGLTGYVAVYAEATSGADTSTLKPTDVEAIVTAYKELDAGADVSVLTPDELTAYVYRYLENDGVDTSSLHPDSVIATVMAYEEITGGALTTSLVPSDITAMVVRYLEAENIDMTALSPDQLEGIVSAFSEATGCDRSELLTDFTAYIARYDDTGAVKPKLSVSVGIYGYDLLAYRKFIAENPVEVQGIVRLSEAYCDPASALSDPNAKFFRDGVQVPVDSVPVEQLTVDQIAVLSEDGTMHVLIAPEVTGTDEAIAEISPLVDEVDRLSLTTAGVFTGTMPTTMIDMVGTAVERVNSYADTLDYNGWERFWALFRGEQADVSALERQLNIDFSPESVAELSAYVGEVVSAIQQGQEISEEDLANLQTILAFLQALDTTNTGVHIREGIAAGMTDAGWDTDAETVAVSLETALNDAFGIHSPSTRVKPVGSSISAGIGTGMKEYDFTSDMAILAPALETALKRALASVPNGIRNVLNLRSVGVNAMDGLRAGILSGRAGVNSAMRIAARDAVNAAKQELQIRSPSAVFEDEVGVMAMRGFGKGILTESKEQARVIRNASRYLTGEAREAAVSYNTNTDKRTYNQQSSVNLSGNNFYVRDEVDIHALAMQIASLTRRQQRGKGTRMA